MNRSKFWHYIPVTILIKYSYFVFELRLVSMAAILKIFLISQFGSELLKLYFIIHYISYYQPIEWSLEVIFHFVKEKLCLMVYFFCIEPLFRFVYNRPLTPQVRRPQTVNWLKKELKLINALELSFYCVAFKQYMYIIFPASRPSFTVICVRLCQGWGQFRNWNWTGIGIGIDTNSNSRNWNWKGIE